MALLRLVQEYTDHKPACPRFDTLNTRLAACTCWKGKVTRLLAQAKRERW